MKKYATILILGTCVLAGAARAEMLEGQWTGEPGTGVQFTWSGGGRSNDFGESLVDDFLTYLSRLDDADKDGFLESLTGQVNPNGYVVLHFSAWNKNVRVELGHMLDANNGPPMTRDLGILSQQGSPQGGEVCYGTMWETLLDAPPPTPQEPEAPAAPTAPTIPEPGTALILLGGAALGILRRHRPREAAPI
ncbi:MAG TPA: PEP-CTERM sorting domain-containing protein [Phycisphaerae bacterium]|nr:PEP-CTERM sorting domain-containing protein [Phycisphaerae bacterium]